MSRKQRLRDHLGDLPGAGFAPSEPRPRMPDWQFQSVMRQCGGVPGPMLMAWLEAQQVTPSDVARWRGGSRKEIG